ncbi:MAG: hypothetical protein MJZ50_09835 [Treponema sp.]|nr:hypothetical protein [Treponema sp.]
MKKIMLLLSLAAALVLFGCANSSSGSDDDTPVPTVSQQTSTATPELPATYIDISGTWYYTRIWNGTNIGEYKAVFEYKPYQKPLESQKDLNFSLGIVTTLKLYDPNGYFSNDFGSLIYDRATNTLYLSNKDENYKITSINTNSILIKADSSRMALRLLSTENAETVLSKTPTAGGSGGDVALSGSYDAAERAGISLRFDKDEGTWAQWYDGIMRKNGTYSQSGSTLTVNWHSDSQNRDFTADFTVSSENGNIILTASSGDTVTIIGQGFGLSESISSGKVTLSK